MIALTLFACGSAPAPPAPEPSPAPAPAASIGGEPILPRPVVLGGISTDAVVAAVGTQAERIARCYEAERAKQPKLRGKVLVKFTIGKDGSVANANVRSTSLRHPPTEECVVAAVRETRFAALARGETAIVSYPFVFPPP